MDGPFRDLRQRRPRGELRRVRRITSVCVLGQAIDHLRGYLLVESLLVLLGWINLTRRRLDILHRHGLLRPGLVHGNGARAIFLEDRLLREGVRLRVRQIADRRLTGHGLLWRRCRCRCGGVGSIANWGRLGEYRGHSSWYRHGHWHVCSSHRGKPDNGTRHGGSGRRNEVCWSNRGTPTHINTRGVDTSTIITSSIDTRATRVTAH